MTATTTAPAEPQTQTVRDVAYQWHAAGFTVLPVASDGSKRPDVRWTRYQQEQPSAKQIGAWFDGAGRAGLGMVTGAISGNIEMFELEGRAVAEGARDKIVPALKAADAYEVWQRLIQGYVDISPSGGPHFIYRVDGQDVPSNTKVASRPKRLDELTAEEQAQLEKFPHKVFPYVLAETRGEGGFTVLAPSHGATHPSGKPWVFTKHSIPGQVATITWDERIALHAAIRAVLDTMPDQESPAPARPRQAIEVDSERPGDEFTRTTSWADVLQPHGWRHIYGRGDMDYWRRPGDDKRIGWSARTGGTYDGLWVWSTSTVFPTEVSITKFRAYSILEHGGDNRSAATKLRKDGYGAKPAARPARFTQREPQPEPQPECDMEPEPEIEPEAEPEFDPVEEFWTCRPSHTLIRQIARERRVGPWAALGGVLAVVCASTGPHLVLPAIVGSPASLNTFWACVGAVGGGKDAGVDVALELVRLADQIPQHEAGTGQGIDASYAMHVGKAGSAQFCDSVLFRVNEIDSLAGHAKMTGSTIMATLRKVYSGQALGAQYADVTKRRPVKAHRYRCAMVVGVQPLKSGALIDDADGGTPQRFVWLPTNDPDRPQLPRGAHPSAIPVDGIWRCPDRLEAYGEMSLSSEADQELLKSGKGVGTRPRIEFKVCETARAAIVEAREARLDLELDAGGDLNAHGLLTRLKIAALLALLHTGRPEVTEDDWQLSGVVMQVSDRTREVCLRSIKDATRKANVAQAVAEVERGQVMADLLTKRVAQSIMRRLRAARLKGDEEAWIPKGKLRSLATTGADRAHFDAAASRLLAAGQIEERGVRGGSKLRACDE